MSQHKVIQIVYTPPEKREIDAFARRFCNRCKIEDTEVIYGFADFMYAAARAQANYLNTQTTQEKKAA